MPLSAPPPVGPTVPDLLLAMFRRAVAAADPMAVVPPALPERPAAGRLLVVGAGKASARMAEAVETAWGPCEGLVITRYGHARPTQGIEIVEAAHPVPDDAGVRATRRMLARVAQCGPGDLVLALISGGASALMCAPAGRVTLAEKQAVNRALLASGAPIGQMNVVRKHLSAVKGGQLAAAAWPARVLALMISDVPGDDPATIGSGPTAGDGATPAEAMAILDRWGIDAPASVRALLSGPTGVVGRDDPRLDRVRNVVCAAPVLSLAAAAELARSAGYEVLDLGDRIEGEARDVARAHAALVRDEAGRARVGGAPPRVILSGGELTVTRRGDGVGGPNAEYALALAIALDAAAIGAPGTAPRVHAIACDTDGVDGGAEIAGAMIGPETMARARSLGLDPAAALDANDAHGFFGRVGGQVVTGPTLTNVNDFRAIVVA